MYAAPPLLYVICVCSAASINAARDQRRSASIIPQQMDSGTSKTKHPPKPEHPTSANTKATVPRIPQEIIDETLDHLNPTIDSDFKSLQSCALVSKSWFPSCRRCLFHTVFFTWNNMNRWLETFPVPEESPAHLVRDIRISSGSYIVFPTAFLEYVQWFPNVRVVMLLGYKIFDRVDHLWGSSPVPHSTTSLIFGPDSLPSMAVQIQDVAVGIPTLEKHGDLVLSGPLVWMDRWAVPGIEGLLGGRLGGGLRIFGEHLASGSVLNRLLHVPSGLHFTHLDILCLRECLLSTVRLAEACSETLVGLSYRVSFHRKCTTPPGALLPVRKY